MRRRPTTILAAAALLAAALGAAQAHAAPAGPGSQATAKPYDEQTVIVRYRDDVGLLDRQSLLERSGVQRTLGQLPAADADVVRVAPDPARVADRLEQSAKVAYAEPNYVVSAQRRPRDPFYRELYGLHNRGQTGGRGDADIDAPGGWRKAGLGSFPKGGQGVPVGIIDTGIDRDHPDLAGKTRACAESVERLLGGDRMREGQCFDDTGHGTHIAGVIGAHANNGIGVTGVAFDSPLIVCRALGGADQTGTVADVARCMHWAQEKGARVISMSFAGPRSETLRHAVMEVYRKGSRRGAVLVAAAGNDGGEAVSYPAGFQQVISVATTDDEDRHASFSNIHRTVELAAPGVDIVSTWEDGRYHELSGTSMSTPYVAGVAAQVRGTDRRMPARKVRAILKRSADDLGPRGRDDAFGFGRVNLRQAIGEATASRGRR